MNISVIQSNAHPVESLIKNIDQPHSTCTDDPELRAEPPNPGYWCVITHVVHEIVLIIVI